MPLEDPFAGIRLSEQTATPKLDQRLFAPDPSPSPAPKPPSSAKTGRPKAPASAPSPPSVPAGTSTSKAPSPSAPRFDLKEEPLYKASFLFTQGELEGLEDLKLELRRQFDAKVTKNGLIRSALHMLLDDHATNGERSYASRKVRKG